MSLIAKLGISFVVAAIASAIISALRAGETIQSIDLPLIIAFFFATTATAIIVGASSAPGAKPAVAVRRKSSSDDEAREQGTVKWFNVSKGFGFIVREDGEEIFVHFRSIRGEGRRGLRDGQRVSFIVSQSDKGPQAEDVIGEN